MSFHSDRPLIVQSDRTLLLEVQNPLFEQVREKIIRFAELEKSPEYIHTYRITPLSLWNAAASGMTAEEIIRSLEQYSKFAIPGQIHKEIVEYVNRYGVLSFKKQHDHLVCISKDSNLIQEMISYKSLKPFFLKQIDDKTVIIDSKARGILKQEMIKLGFPVQDLAGYQKGNDLSISLLPFTKEGNPFSLRDYQREAISAFYAGGSVYGGSGVLVLPCGAGKTIIGLGVMAEIKNETLILTTNTTSVRQWVQEILDKTTLTSDKVGEYHGSQKEVKPVTVATYQILTHRNDKESEFTHMKLFQKRNWGLIIYDEVHLLPAPVFRYTANIQAKRRLGLTATLIREDQKEEEVFTLIGPKKYDVPWIQMESQGWIAEALCTEIRLPMPEQWQYRYRTASPRQKYRIATTNPLKLAAIKKILEKHRNDSILIIGQYVQQLKEIADRLNIPLITGKVKQEERDRLYKAFKKGEIKQLVVSKVANFAIDLPDAKVAVQISGTFGSRQEEAQRLGRILRPKKGENQAYFYTLVSADTVDQDYAMKRQLFLIEQGYRYEIKQEKD